MTEAFIGGSVTDSPEHVCHIAFEATCGDAQRVPSKANGTAGEAPITSQRRQLHRLCCLSPQVSRDQYPGLIASAAGRLLG